MFEKEAEEYYNGQYDAWLEGEDSFALEEEIEQAFKDGAEFGYNKANEWHYVKDEGLPKIHVWYFVQYNNDTFDCAIVTKDLRILNFYTSKDMTEAVYAWKEIVLPKESK